MAKRVSKASLLRRIKALESEIDDILSFNMLPVESVKSPQQERELKDSPEFIPIHWYARRYCLHTGEIGVLRRVRYVR